MSLLCVFLCTFTFQTSRLRIGTVTGRTELAHGPVPVHAARGVRGTRDVRARVDARKVDARLVLRATGVPEAHGRGWRTVVGAHAHGPVIEHQAPLVGRARAARRAPVARTQASALSGAPEMRSAIGVGPALALGGRARQLAQLADGETELARAPRPVVAHHAGPGRFARQPVARVPTRAVHGAARPGRRAVRVRGAPGRRDRTVAGALHAAARVRRASHRGVARVTVRARALGPVQHRPA